MSGTFEGKCHVAFKDQTGVIALNGQSGMPSRKSPGWRIGFVHTRQDWREEKQWNSFFFVKDVIPVCKHKRFGTGNGAEFVQNSTENLSAMI